VFRVKSINTGNLPAAQWSMTLGAFGLRSASLTAGMLPGGSLLVSAAAISPRGIAMSGRLGAAVSGGTCAAAVRRFRPDGVTAPVIPAAVSKQEAHNHNQAAQNHYTTTVDVDGVGASGPPRERETA
jgi:hypothetical protein